MNEQSKILGQVPFIYYTTLDSDSSKEFIFNSDYNSVVTLIRFDTASHGIGSHRGTTIHWTGSSGNITCESASASGFTYKNNNEIVQHCIFLFTQPPTDVNDV